MESKKKYIIAGVILVLVLIIGAFFLLNQKPKETEKQSAMPTEAVIPTVDSSVIVLLESKIAGKELALKVSGIPKGTTSFEYSLSYDTKAQGIQGIIGTVTLTNNASSYEKDLTLGTCSSGKCVYHEVVGAITLSLKFNGDYGEKIFEKEYTL
jgi:hypothetical protein